MQTSRLREQLLSDGQFFRSPDAACRREAQRLSKLGLVQLDTVRYVRCFDIRDRDSSRRSWGRECQGIIELNDALDENAGQVHCPECDAVARPSRRRTHEGLRTHMLADGVIGWVGKLLADLGMEPEPLGRAAFRVVAEDRVAIITVFDFCDDARFTPGAVVSGAPILPIVVNSFDLLDKFTGQGIEPVTAASLVDDPGMLARAIKALPDRGADARSGLSVHERARRLSLGNPLTIHLHEHQAGSQYFEEVTINVRTPAAEGSPAYGNGRFNDAVYFPATDEEYEQLKRDTTLLIDLQRRRVFYKGIEIPTRPVGRGQHLQKQPLAVLAFLALHKDEAVSETDLDEALYELELLDDKLGTNLRDMRRRIVKAFEDAVEGTSIKAKEVKALIQTIRGLSKLKLDVKGSVRVIGMPEPKQKAGKAESQPGS